MVRGRYSKAKVARDDAYRRQREANEAAAAAALRLESEWGSRDKGLHRLRDISRQLDKLHRDESALLRERDGLVGALRSADVSWALLSTWSGLSRQALSKRTSAVTGPR
jgi:hypothetical protein